MKKKILHAFLFTCFFINAASAQSVDPQVINTTGGSYSFGAVIIDWNVGEMALVNTMQSANLQVLVTNGFLQPFTDKPDEINNNNTFGPEEIKVFPNPASTYVEIDILTKQQGRIGLKLYDATGKTVYKNEFYSYGIGRIIRIDMQRWASAEYYLHIVLEPESGFTGKKGAYKIIKLR